MAVTRGTLSTRALLELAESMNSRVGRVADHVRALETCLDELLGEADPRTPNEYKRMSKDAWGTAEDADANDPFRELEAERPAGAASLPSLGRYA